MTAMSTRSDSRPPDDGRRPRTFRCRDDLYGAFERRARELECSVDWLLGEAMKRLLADAALVVPPQPVTPQVRPSLPVLSPPRPLPPPPPSRAVTIALRLEEQRVVVDRDRFVLGRSGRDAHLALRDPGVSRQHAIIERAPGGGWMVVDMASTNGIRVNGARVTRAPLRAGDRLAIGPFEISVERA